MKQDDPIICTFSIMRSPEAIEIIALAGFNAVILDLEHGPYSIDSLGSLILAARARGIYAIVRVLKNDPVMIGAVLDAGADGVLVPQVSTKSEAQVAVDAARFAPDGMRGANSWVRAADFGGSSDWFAKANREVAVIVMIEGKAGVENVMEIVSTPSLDGVFLGPVDLSHSLGVPGQVDHDLVLEKMRHVLSVAKLHSLATAVFSPTPEASKRWIDMGARIVACGVDTGHLLQAMKSAVSTSRKGI
ncbi:HpcH/HpaI aldolase family protein [Aliirhizobium smilacinae]|uniref:Aldolase n=1 Tax=Aliirhizobium smilacinae TaxID=1395944 RepID=A0A5C4X8E6_9HYPH|nr:aldolase/citrate lyase family protein [Rhizobium smilacinae]TNM59609.1 aldolase [Rhizobium smilacinae]